MTTTGQSVDASIPEKYLRSIDVGDILVQIDPDSTKSYKLFSYWKKSTPLTNEELTEYSKNRNNYKFWKVDEVIKLLYIPYTSTDTDYIEDMTEYVLNKINTIPQSEVTDAFAKDTRLIPLSAPLTEEVLVQASVAIGAQGVMRLLTDNGTPHKIGKIILNVNAEKEFLHGMIDKELEYMFGKEHDTQVKNPTPELLVGGSMYNMHRNIVRTYTQNKQAYLNLTH